MAFEIRLATEEDAESIIEITREAFALYKKQSGADKLEALDESYSDVVKDIREKLVFVAMSDGEPVGCVRVEIKGDKTAWLTRFAVKVDSHNGGIGKKLITRIDEVMKEKGVKSISLYTASEVESLMSFYGGCGFSIESTDNKRGYTRSELTKKYI